MMPDMDGFAVTRHLREAGLQMPVLFLTARDDMQDKIQGLTVGGDDYVTKPFGLEEVVARIRAILRRTKTTVADEPKMRVGDITLDEDARSSPCRNASRPVPHRIQAAPLPDAQRRPGRLENADLGPRLGIRLGRRSRDR